jgi:5-hydroxyisourate hydrolase
VPGGDLTTLSTHVLDTGSGEPAAGMRVHLSKAGGGGWEPISEFVTDDVGRVGGFGDLESGRYRLGFETGDYGSEFYPFVHVVFDVDADQPHYHIPLLLSPYGYSTYRGR